MRVFVPYNPIEPKTRLSPLLSEQEREEFSQALLLDVCECIRQTENTPIVLTTRELEITDETMISSKPLSAAVNETLTKHFDTNKEITSEPLGIVMADLGLINVDALNSLLNADSELALAPGRRGGTNGLVTRSAAFRVNYHGASYLDHREIARKCGLNVTEIDSFRLSTDIDEPCDIVELLLHGTGAARIYVERRFNLDVDGSSIRVRRIQ